MPPLPPDQTLNAALASFTGAIQGYFPLILLWGARLLTGVAFLGFGYALLQAVLKRDWMGTFMAFGFGAIRIALVYGVMNNLWFIGSALPDMGGVIGAQVSGQSPNVLSPSGIYDLGLNIVSLLFQNRHLGGWFNLVADGEFLLLIVLTQVTWFGAALVYLWTLFECQWYVVKGPVTICFAAFDHTWPTFINWFVQLLRAGIKLMATLIILAVGLFVAQQWTATLKALGVSINMNPAEYGAIQLVEGILFFYAVWTQPAKAAAIIHAQGAAGNSWTDEGAAGMYGIAMNAARMGARAVVGGGQYVVRRLS